MTFKHHRRADRFGWKLIRPWKWRWWTWCTLCLSLFAAYLLSPPVVMIFLGLTRDTDRILSASNYVETFYLPLEIAAERSEKLRWFYQWEYEVVGRMAGQKSENLLLEPYEYDRVD